MTRRGIPFYTVDAFTDSPFSGNPAAVCLDADDLSDEGRQQIAQEMNLSETAFVYRPASGDVRRLRWFTPVAEVPLCGHATLASAHVLVREKGVAGPVAFDSASGPLTVREDDGRLLMDFPANPATEALMPEGLLEALLGSAARPLRHAHQPVFAASNKVALVVLPSEDAVLSVPPRLRGAGAGRDARRTDGGRGHGAGGRPAGGLRVALLRPLAGSGRGPGYRRRPYDPGPLVGDGPGQDGDVGPSAVGAGRLAGGARPRRPGGADRPGGDGRVGNDRSPRGAPSDGARRQKPDTSIDSSISMMGIPSGSGTRCGRPPAAGRRRRVRPRPRRPASSPGPRRSPR